MSFPSWPPGAARSSCSGSCRTAPRASGSACACRGWAAATWRTGSTRSRSSAPWCGWGLESAVGPVVSRALAGAEKAGGKQGSSDGPAPRAGTKAALLNQHQAALDLLTRRVASLQAVQEETARKTLAVAAEHAHKLDTLTPADGEFPKAAQRDGGQRHRIPAGAGRRRRRPGGPAGPAGGNAGGRGRCRADCRGGGRAAPGHR